MIPCSCCGYHFPEAKLKNTAVGRFCQLCTSIGGDKVAANPNAFGEAKHLLPPMAYATNMLLTAISTRASVDDVSGEAPAPAAEEEGIRAFLILGEDNTLMEVQDENGQPIELHPLRYQKVEGTDFRKMAVMLPLK